MSKASANQAPPPHRTDSLIAQLTGVLTWRSHLSLPTELYTSHLHYLDLAISRWLSDVCSGEPKTGELVSASLGELPEASRRRLLTAPQIYYRLISRSEVSKEAAPFFYDSIRAERHLIHPELYLDRPLWTALGDFYFPAGPAGGSESSPEQPFRFEPDVMFRAPRVAARLPLDGVSPFSELHIPGYTQEIALHTAGELEVILDKLTDAFERVRATSAHVADVITLVTKVIAVRKDLADADGFGSSSWSTFIGKTAMTNAHLECNELSSLANSLIHEAIHSLLYIAELIEPFCSDQSLLHEYEIDSPWTGNTLYLHSYLHACFVWFGLWCFWSLALDTRFFPEEEIMKRIHRSGSGFLRNSALQPLTKLREYFKPQLLDAISMMQGLVTAR